MENKYFASMAEVAKERQSQDWQWGGPEHDDKHMSEDWVQYIQKQANRCYNYPNELRERMVKVAALAIAAIESLDRTGPKWCMECDRPKNDCACEVSAVSLKEDK